MAIIQKLKPILQKCKIEVKRTANENRDVSEADRQASTKANAKSEQTKHIISFVNGSNSLVSKHAVSQNSMANQCEIDNEDTASTISSIPADYEADTLASFTEYVTAQQSVTESEEKPQVDHQLLNAIVEAIELKKAEKCE